MAFSPPAQCNVVGSYVSRTMVSSQKQLGIDMVVQMPKSLFQDKDYQNMRYFYRRAYYIAYIAAHIHKEFTETMETHFECLHENPLLPVLVLHPRASADAKSEKKSKKTADSGPAYSIRIIPCATDNLFPYSKLTATSSNLRTDDASTDKKTNTTTPFYNSTLNAERTYIQFLRVITSVKKECAGFTDACALGRIWLQQRGFGSALSQGGFGSFEWAAITALLLKSGGRNGQAALSTALSGTELFKAVIQYLASTDFTKKAVILGSTTADTNNMKESDPVLFDGAREVNILYKMSNASADYLKLYAKSISELLADESADPFEPSFIAKADVPLQAFDAVFTVKLPTKLAAKTPDSKDLLAFFASEVHRILKRAYGNRAVLVHTQLPPKKQWKLTANAPNHTGNITVGVIFDPANMSRQMEYGPSAEDQKEAAKFRQFWGEKSELRRFKSGSILECVEWSNKLPLQISEEIAAYALGRHLKVDKDGLELFGEGLVNILNFSHTDKETFDSVRSSFQYFERDIRNLENLPLQIRQLSPISPAGRYTSIEAPAVGFHAEEIQPLEVNLYFEASNRWPENLIAIQEAKIEFLLDLDRRLSAAHDNITTHIGRENRPVGVQNLAYLDILYDTGAAYRLRINTDLEETLLERQVANNAIEGRVRETADAALKELQWQFNIRPLHSQTIATYCTRFPALSPTIRLVKQWFASHKLTGHFSDELIELIVLYVFIKPYPWSTPSSVSTGFLRTIHFLSRWDWRDEPLIVDAAEEMTTEQRESVQAVLDSHRKRDPTMNHVVLIAATSYDLSGLGYTRNSPTKITASRMTRLAKAAAKLIREQGKDLDAMEIFETAIQDYDFLLRLSPSALRSTLLDAGVQHGTAKKSAFKNLDAATASTPLPIRARPVDVLADELSRLYEDTMILFPGGADDDNIIAGLWNPRLQKQKFRAGLPHNFSRVEGEDADVVDLNRKAVLLEIARLGGSLIKQIHVNEE